MRMPRSITMIAAGSFAAILLLSGCDSESDQPSTPKRDTAPKPAARHIEAPPVPAVIEIDPNSLDGEKRKLYDKGFSQGLKMAEGYYKKTFEAGRSVQDLMKDRDTAIQVALQLAGRTGADHPEVLLTCGRKAGLKEGLAKHDTPAQ